jgi:hypothetical protein
VETPSWWYDEPERDWAGDWRLPDETEERLEDLDAETRQRTEDAPQ